MLLFVLTCEASSSRVKTMSKIANNDEDFGYRANSQQMGSSPSYQQLTRWAILGLWSSVGDTTQEVLDASACLIAEPQPHSWLHADYPCVFELIETKDDLHAGSG